MGLVANSFVCRLSGVQGLTFTHVNSRSMDFWSMAGLVRAGRRPGIYGVLVGGWARQSRPGDQATVLFICFTLNELRAGIRVSGETGSLTRTAQN